MQTAAGFTHEARMLDFTKNRLQNFEFHVFEPVYHTDSDLAFFRDFTPIWPPYRVREKVINEIKPRKRAIERAKLLAGCVDIRYNQPDVGNGFRQFCDAHFEMTS